MWPRDEALRFFAAQGRAAQGAADRREDRRTVRGVRATRSRTATPSSTSASGRTCPSTGRLKAFKLLTTSNAYWKGDAQEPADAAGLRHGVSQRVRAEGPSPAARRSEEAGPPQGRQGSRPVHVPQVGAGRDLLAGEGHGALEHARRLHAQRAHPGGLRRGEGADYLQQGVVGDIGPLAALSREHVPRRERRRADGPQGDELPRALPHLRERRAQLSRPADPPARADAAAPATKPRACCPA